MAGERPKFSVEVGPLTVDDSDAVFKDDEEPGNAVWSDYLVNSKYESDGHIFMLGGTAEVSQASVGFVQLANHTLLWIADWTASRHNTKPKIPDTITNDQDWVLLDKHYEPAQVVVGPDGVTPLWRISGTYIYGHRKPNSNTLKHVVWPRPPWMEDNFDRSVPANITEKSIIDAGNMQQQGGLTGFPLLIK